MPYNQSAPSEPLNFERDGAERLNGVACPFLAAIDRVLAHLPPDRAGIRITDTAALAAMLATDGLIGRIGPAARPVRALLFDKTAHTNWALGWHQDRTIVVRARHDTPDYGPWTIKQGLHHVAPPFALLEAMVTLRVHLDPVPVTNAPLRIAPGSHRAGRISERDIEAVVRRCGTEICTADVGDIWLYATPILHASDRATDPTRRRVLQIDYAASALPNGLEWLGI